jgi:tetratricopeptide (TPR) repeat protein
VADLGEDERNLLDVAACCGFEFDPLLVGEALGVARVPLLRALGQIERRHRLVRSSGLRYAFDHHQVQEALYGSLSELLRREYHTALATALEARTNAAAADPNALDGSLCVDLCEHHLRGVDARRAVRYLPAAQRHLQRGFVTAQAMALAERALAAPGLLTGPERAKVLYAHSMTLERVGRYAEEEAAAREIGRLAAEAGDERQALRAEVLLGMVLWRTSRLAEAEAAYGRAARLAEASGDRTVYAQIENGLGNVFSEAGRFEEAREHFARALAMHRESGNRSGEAAATVNVGVALDEQGRVEEAMEHYRRAVVLCREIGQRQYEVNVTLNIGSVLRRQGRLDEARDHFERVLSIAREIGSRLAEAGALGHLGDNRRETGDFAGAKEYLLAALAIREQMGDRAGVAAMRLGLAHVLLDAGETELGRKLTAEAYDAAAALGGAAVETETIARCRLAWLPGGDLAGAERCLAENAERLNSEALLDARWSLWRASGNRAHLEAAKRLLDDAVAKTPEPHRASMVANQRTNRDIDAAARAAGL